MTPDYATILSALGVLGVAFGVFSYFKDPQVKLEKGEGLMSMSINQLQKDLANLRDNHLHTLEVKMDEMRSDISKMSIEITRLGTIIEERIPRKNN